MPLARSHADPQKSLVGFVVADEAYALPIEAVREIVNPQPLTELPHAPPFVLGVTDHRGVVLPVIQRRTLLDIRKPAERRGQWILIDVDDTLVGVAVDGATDVFGTKGQPLMPPPPEHGVSERLRLAGVTEHDGRLTFVIDIENLRDWARSVREAGLRGGVEVSL
jgi:purine-binding chemotaxis protein CheW